MCEAQRLFTTMTKWKSHQIQFPKYFPIFFVAWKIFGIHVSQIEIEYVFLIVRMLTTLWCCRLEVDNFNKFVIIMKNWCGCKLDIRNHINPLK
jgi:hypothetical protein